MTEHQRDRITAAFDRELARSPIPPDLRTQVVRRAVANRDELTPPRRQWAPALIAVLLAVAIVATLIGVRALHSMPPTSARHGPQITLLHNGYLVAADGNSLVAIDPATGSRHTLLSAPVPLSDPAYSADGTKLAYLQGGGSIRVLDSATGNVSELTTCSCGTSSHLSWSPDGSRLAYSMGGEPGGADLYLIEADGTHRTQLTHSPFGVYAWQPSWSPDGTRIAFSLRGTGIDVINADGSGLRVLIAERGDWSYPAWSPDGSRIAYTVDPSSLQAKPGPFEYELWEMDPSGSQRTRIWVSQGCCVTAWGGPTWSPDATRIATVTFNTVWVMNADGGNPQSLGTTGIGQRPTWQPVPIAPITLLHNGYVVVSNGNGLIAVGQTHPPVQRSILTLQTGEEVSDAAYTQDGTRLAYLKGGGSIWVLDAATGRTQQLTRCFCAKFSHLSWSPDGSRLAFTDVDQFGGTQVYLIDADGTHRTQLTHLSVAQSASQPSWSPDGTRIAFSTRGNIDVIRTDGSGLVVLLTDANGIWDPAWSPDGARIAYVLDPRSPPGTRTPFEYQLWLMDADGSHRTKIFVSPGCCVTAWGGPAWSPDGTRIAVVALPGPGVGGLGGGGSSYALWVMNADGSDAVVEPVTVAGDRPTWQPVP